MPAFPSTVFRVLLLSEFISFCLSVSNDSGVTSYNAALSRPVLPAVSATNGKFYDFSAYLLTYLFSK